MRLEEIKIIFAKECEISNNSIIALCRTLQQINTIANSFKQRIPGIIAKFADYLRDSSDDFVHKISLKQAIKALSKFVDEESALQPTETMTALIAFFSEEFEVNIENAWEIDHNQVAQFDDGQLIRESVKPAKKEPLSDDEDLIFDYEDDEIPSQASYGAHKQSPYSEARAELELKREAAKQSDKTVRVRSAPLNPSFLEKSLPMLIPRKKSTSWTDHSRHRTSQNDEASPSPRTSPEQHHSFHGAQLATMSFAGNPAFGNKLPVKAFMQPDKIAERDEEAELASPAIRKASP